MSVLYWLAGAFAFAAALSARSRAAGPAVVFTALALVLFAVTPVGHDVVSWFHDSGARVADTAAAR